MTSPFLTSPSHTSLINIGTHSLSLTARGPPLNPSQAAIILESGAASSSHGLAALARSISSTSRVYLYDRSGLGLSEPFPPGTESTSLNHVRALRNLLQAADIAPPFVICGWSYGGIIARLFAEEYKQDVHGIVLLDSMPYVPAKPVGRLLGLLLGGADYFEAVGLGACKMTAGERRREGEMETAGGPDAYRAEIACIRAGVEEVNARQGVRSVNGRLVCTSHALGNMRVCVVSGGLRDDFEKIWRFAVEKGNGTEEDREEMRMFLEENKEEGFVQMQEALVGLSRDSRFMQTEGAGRTHMLVQTVPDEIAELVQWACGK